MCLYVVYCYVLVILNIRLFVGNSWNNFFLQVLLQSPDTHAYQPSYREKNTKVTCFSSILNKLMFLHHNSRKHPEFFQAVIICSPLEA